jgi:hypothetical protein
MTLSAVYDCDLNVPADPVIPDRLGLLEQVSRISILPVRMTLHPPPPPNWLELATGGGDSMAWARLESCTCCQ